ncbi:unnamed protein product [Brassica oleracea var. botrytis]
MKERPKWMKTSSLDELKTKVGHVIVMILLVKMLERSKMVTVATGLELLSYSKGLEGKRYSYNDHQVKKEEEHVGSCIPAPTGPTVLKSDMEVIASPLAAPLWC